MDGSHPTTIRPESAGDSLRRREAALRDEALAAAEAIMADLADLRDRCADLAETTSLPVGPANVLRLVAQSLGTDLATLKSLRARSQSR